MLAPEQKRFYPHLARTLWTDAALDATHTPELVAAWLNNTTAVVYRHYRELRTQKHIEEAVAFNRSQFALIASPSYQCVARLSARSGSPQASLG